MNKESVIKTIFSPGMAFGIGAAAALGGAIDSSVSNNHISTKIEQTFPHMVSPTKIEQAKREILVFDQNMHDAVESGVTIVDINKVSYYPSLRHAIELVNQEEEIAQKRNTLYSDLAWKRFKTITLPSMLGGIALATIGTVGRLRMMRNRQKERRQTLPINS